MQIANTLKIYLMKYTLSLLVASFFMSCTSTPPKSNWDYENVLGKTIKVENLEIAEYDFPTETHWAEAKNLCSNLGEGWRLPNREELNLIYLNREKIKNLKFEKYWCVSDDKAQYFGYAYIQDFYSGKPGFQYQSGIALARAVKKIK